MIKIKVNKARFEYDIYSLVQAFFPHHDIFIDYDVDEKEEQFLPYQVKNRKKVLNEDETIDFLIKVYYYDDKKLIDISLEEKEDKLVKEKEKDVSSEGKNISERNLKEIYREKIHVKDIKDTKAVKNDLKKSIYLNLSKVTNKTLPWGTLTGIRPTKIILNKLLSDSEGDVYSYVKETYLASDEKTKLGIFVSKREIELLNNLHTLVRLYKLEAIEKKAKYEEDLKVHKLKEKIEDKKENYDKRLGYSIYIGIPFCPTTCLYCSFPSYNMAVFKGQVRAYLDALKKEIVEVAKLFRGRILDTLYIGGGTPTSLNANELSELFSLIYENFDMDHIKEFNVEAGRPDSIDREKLLVMKKYNVTRISINPQTMNEKTLRIIGRDHSIASVYESFNLARSLEFNNINMDLILGLPGENKDDILYTFDEIRKLHPDSLTIHSLAIKTHSRLYKEWSKYENYAMENSNFLMAESAGLAESLGMSPYYLYRQKNMAGNLENVGYSALGKEGKYNILIMEEQEDIVALGAGTASKHVLLDGSTKRCENVRDIKSYIERIDEMIERKKELFFSE